MAAKVFSATTIGLDAFPVEVEVDVSPGLYSFKIVGLPDKAVEEAKERIISALKNSGFSPPSKTGKKIVVNLAPADIKKEGAGFDLPMALGVLLANQEIKIENLGNTIFIGELGLDGYIRKIPGVLSIAQMAKEKGFKKIVVPYENYNEAKIIEGIEILPCKNFEDLIHILEGRKGIEYPPANQYQNQEADIDFSDIKGLNHAKRALEIAAAGRHNVLLTGFPGTGKTLLAKAFAGILPSLTKDEAIEITKIYSIAGLLPEGCLINKRPFRSPHHTASGIAIIGGGTWPKPGEVSLAHRGVLFLDEFPEFSRQVIENLRQPLEEGYVTVSRAKMSIRFPARFTLIAAMNPCPCGWYGDSRHQCSCSLSKIIQYRKKISGPILDRIDLIVEVPRIPFETLSDPNPQESSLEIRKRVEKARQIQQERFKGINIITNSEMTAKNINNFVKLPPKINSLLKEAADSFSLSARAIHRTIKVARTIADLEGENEIKQWHLAEALQYRPKDELLN
jgi:magnesium chelatase family protein